MKTTLRLFLLLGVGLVHNALAQHKLSKRFNVWYFGIQAGLDFNASAKPLTGGQFATYLQEAAATWCDEAGNLLFYTNGRDVWDRNHQRMVGYTAGQLGSHFSASQGALVVPLPGSSTRCFIFTVPESGNGGLRVTEVDLSRNGGLGEVASPPRELLTPVTEKLTAVPHCNGTDYWVLVHKVESHDFAAFLVSASGVAPTPVLSDAGSRHSAGPESIGHLKASPNGGRLAATILGQNALELFTFNNATGRVSNPVRLTVPATTRAYGLEFSPNGKWLYFSGGYDENLTTGVKTIYQLDATGTTAPGLAASVLEVGQSPAGTVGALQLGPDGKIYVAQWDYHATTSRRGYESLGVITQPDQRGPACAYVPLAVPFPPRGADRRVQIGLPNLIAGFCRKPPEVECQQVLGGACGGGLLRALVTNADTVTYEWFRNGVKIPDAIQATYKPNVAGKFKVKIKEALTACPLEAESAEVDVSLLNSTADLKPQILPQSCGTFVLKVAVTADFTVQWTGPGLTGPAAQRDTVRVSGQTGEVTYRVSVASRADPTCKADTSLKVSFNQPPPYRLGSNALSGTCGQSLALNAPLAPGWTEIRWQLPDGQIVAQNPYATRTGGTYTVLARNASGCESRDQVTVTFQGASTPPQLSAPVTVCPGQPAPALTATGENVTWFADSTLTTRLGTGNSFVPNLGSQRGTVAFFATQTSSEGCASRAARTNVVVAEAPKLSLSSRSVTTCFDENQSLLLDAGTLPGVSYVWSRAGSAVGSNAPTLAVRAPGLYRVRATNAGGCASLDSVEVTEQCKPFVYLPDVFTPNGDGVNDAFEPKGQAIDDFELTVYNRWGEAIHRTQGRDFAAASGQFWNGTVRGQAAPGGVYAWRIRVRSAQWPEPFVKAGQVLLQR